MTATANIDDTPEKEDIVLIVVDTKPRTFFEQPRGSWQLEPSVSPHYGHQIILGSSKKELFKLFDTGKYPLDVPAKSIELHDPPSANFKQPTDVSFRLVDATGDGTLDVWVESAYGVALISFENGAFKEVSSNYTVTREKLIEAFEIEASLLRYPP